MEQNQLWIFNKHKLHGAKRWSLLEPRHPETSWGRRSESMAPHLLFEVNVDDVTSRRFLRLECTCLEFHGTFPRIAYHFWNYKSKGTSIYDKRYKCFVPTLTTPRPSKTFLYIAVDVCWWCSRILVTSARAVSVPFGSYLVITKHITGIDHTYCIDCRLRTSDL